MKQPVEHRLAAMLTAESDSDVHPTSPDRRERAVISKQVELRRARQDRHYYVRTVVDA